MIDSTGTPGGGFNLPENYNPLHDPRVKNVTDSLFSKIAILEKEKKDIEPVLKEWKEKKDSEKTLTQRLEELTKENQNLQNWQKETVKKSLVQTKVTHKLNELAAAGTGIVPQFIAFEQLYQIEDVNSEAFSKALNDILNQAFVDQILAFKTVNQPFKPTFPTSTPGASGQPQAVQGTLGQAEYDVYRQIFGANTVIRQS